MIEEMLEVQTKNALPKGWKTLDFGEIIDFLTDYQANGSFAGLKENVRYYSDKNYAVLVRLKDLRSKLKSSDDFVYTDEKGYNFLKKSRVKEGDILVANVGAGVGTTLKMPRFEGKTTLGPNMFRVDLKDYVLPKYFLAFSNSMNYWHQLNVVSAGSGQPKINKAQYRSIKIPVPPIDVQQKIVSKIEELFSELDKGIEELKTAQQQLKVYRQAVLKWAFEGKLTNEDVTDGELPEGWKEVTIGEMFEVFVGSTPSRKNIGYWNGDTHWISSGEVAFKSIIDTREKISKEGLENSSCKVHPPGTVIMAMIGEGKTRGQAAILKVPAAHNQNTAAIRVSSIYKSELLYYFLVLKYEENRKIGSGNNQKALNKERVKSISIPFIPFKEQEQIIQEIDSRLIVCDKIEETIANSLKQAEALRQSILKKAFKGKL
jgi:type I restriction enzyme S subunit